MTRMTPRLRARMLPMLARLPRSALLEVAEQLVVQQQEHEVAAVDRVRLRPPLVVRHPLAELPHRAAEPPHRLRVAGAFEVHVAVVRHHVVACLL